MLFAVFEFQEVFDRFREHLTEKGSDVLASLAYEKHKSGSFLTEKLEFDTRERSCALAKPRDPGEAGGTGLVAPVAPLWLSWVCFRFGFNPRLSTSLPICTRLPSGVPLFPWPRVPSSQASPRTRKCLFAIAHSPWVRVYQEDSEQASLSLLIPGKCEEMQIKTAFSLFFPLCSGIGVTLSAFTDCLRQRSDAGLWWRPGHDGCRSFVLFFFSLLL